MRVCNFAVKRYYTLHLVGEGDLIPSSDSSILGTFLQMFYCKNKKGFSFLKKLHYSTFYKQFVF